MKDKTAELFLSFFKAGDDLSRILGANDSKVSKSLEIYAERLDSSAKKLRRLAQYIGAKEVIVAADTHCVIFTGPEDLIDFLIKEDLLSKVR